MDFKTYFNQFEVTEFGYTELSKPISYNFFENWIKQDHHLPLKYLEGERQNIREDIKKFWPEFESSLVFIFSYHGTHQVLKDLYEEKNDYNGLKIASYTLGFDGLDYHHYLKNKLHEIGASLNSLFDLDYKITLDVHPVLERDLAYRAGLGWFGKNSMLINQKEGSFFIIGSLLLNKKLPIENGFTELDHCGSCTKCVDACPTEAIDPMNRQIIAKDCISTFTIEQFRLDTPVSDKMTLQSGFVFGCDICQDVCPWNIKIDKNENRKIKMNTLQDKIISFFLRQPPEMIKEKLENFSKKEFNNFFSLTSFERSQKRGLLKNIILYLKS